jgi:DNA-binding CsgD family transcriptional regulator
MEKLTVRELELAHLVAAGFSNRQIARMLVICRQTVKNDVQNIYKKLQVENRVQVCLYLTGENVRDLQLCAMRNRTSFRHLLLLRGNNRGTFRVSEGSERPERASVWR